jgi:ATP-binding cassette subfamily F protein 3
MRSKDVLKHALMEYDGTLIVVSHDRDFLADLTNRTIEFRDRQLHNHIGDVNAFLEKRALDSMREVEKKQNTPRQIADESNKKELSYEERKKLLRAVDRAEKKIEKLENKISNLEQEMANPDFYTSPQAEEKSKAYAQFKKELELAMEDWEEAQEALE